MADERLYMNTVNGWEKMIQAISVNAGDLPQLEANIGPLRAKVEEVRGLYAQHAALAAARHETTQELQRLIEEGDELLRFLRAGAKAHYGKRSSKLIEFGVQPLRARARKKPAPPATETTAPALQE